jgi:hypothetical protein
MKANELQINNFLQAPNVPFVIPVTTTGQIPNAKNC